MTPSAEQLRRFADAIEARFGIRVGDRPTATAEIVGRRAAARRETVAAYLHLVEGADPAELRALATEVTIGETYFFRHIEQFHAYADLLPALVARGTVRVLSAGCASGEEAYTLSILARERLAPGAVAIEAFDVSAAALARAARARYTRWALRATSAEHEARWFVADGDERVLAKQIREAVTFREANLLDPQAAPAGRYDVVFCRNVLMYFGRERAAVVIDRLIRALVPGGYLFLGHAETLRDYAVLGLELCHSHGTFFYRRTDGSARIAPVMPAPVASRATDDSWVGEIAAASRRVSEMIDGALGVRMPEIVIEDGPSVTSDRLPSDRLPSERLPSDRLAGDSRDGRSGLDPLSAIRTSSDRLPSDRVPSPRLASDHSPAGRPGLDPLFEIRSSIAEERFADALAAIAKLPLSIAEGPDGLLLRAIVAAQTGDLATARTTCSALIAGPHRASAYYLLAICEAADPATSERHARAAIATDPEFALAAVHLGLLSRRRGDRTATAEHLTRAIELLGREPAARLALFGGGFGAAALARMCRAELLAVGGPE